MPGTSSTLLRPTIDPEEDAQALTARLAALGAQALSETVETAAYRDRLPHPPGPQRLYLRPHAHQGAWRLIDWTKPAGHIHDQVRGLIPWPCASTELGGGYGEDITARR